MTVTQGGNRQTPPSFHRGGGIVNGIAHRDYGIVGHRVMVDVFNDRVGLTIPGRAAERQDAGGGSGRRAAQVAERVDRRLPAGSAAGGAAWRPIKRSAADSLDLGFTLF